MLTKELIQVLIIKRLIKGCDSCNSYYLDIIQEHIRILLTVLNDGKKYSGHFLDSCTNVLDEAGIPWNPLGEDGWDVPNEWLVERGCTISEKDGIISHPQLLEW
jgi:hypothetical protein